MVTNMSETRFHGARTKEETDITRVINDIDSSVIGVIVVADDADEDAFPLNIPTLITRPQSMLGKAGKTGTLYKTLKAISDQASAKIIVVRVATAKPPEEGKAAETQSQLIIGGSDADGNYTGMYALLTAEQKTGYRPRVLAVPEYDTEEVTSQLCVIAKQLRAFVYAGCNGCNTLAEARQYRETFASRELMLIWPNYIAYNQVSGANEEFPAPAYAVGLRAFIDNQYGWHRSLSNIAVSNVLGMSKDVFWALQAEDSDAQTLNNDEITTIIKRNGFRFWGNRTTDTNEFTFEVYTRTAQILADTIAEAQFETVDGPLTPTNVKDVVSAINKKLSALVTAGKLLGAEAWFDIVDNPTANLIQGKVAIRYKYTPVPPMEDLTLIQTFTDEYFEGAFSSLGSN